MHPHTWNDVVDVEIATFDWVNWWNESRLHQSLGYRTPAEVEPEFWSHQPTREIIKNKANAQAQNPGHFKPSTKGQQHETSDIHSHGISLSPYRLWG
ncbi:hypothetical protein D8M19_01535 [Corynebacterium pseudodiphtheriticum]|nr:hypothetical protein D8M19_01535 [Corynebacterium pseudodiphtheriticum]